MCACVCARCHSCPSQINADSLRQPAGPARESVRAWIHGFSMHQMGNESTGSLLAEVSLVCGKSLSCFTQHAQKPNCDNRSTGCGNVVLVSSA